MRRYLFFTLSVLIFGVTAACAQPTPTPPAPTHIPAPTPPTPVPTPVDWIKPGAWVGDMVLTTARPEDFAASRRRPDLFDACDPTAPAPGSHTRRCEVPAAIELFIGYGASAATAAALDAQWAKTSWEMILDDHVVDLAAFGTIDLQADGSAPVRRLWNVVATHPPPGSHALRYVSTTDGESTAVTWIFTVVPPAVDDE
jgi:hypothetical protein